LELGCIAQLKVINALTISFFFLKRHIYKSQAPEVQKWQGVTKESPACLPKGQQQGIAGKLQ